MFIRPFVTRRIRADLKEISIQSIIDICEVPEGLTEHANQVFLEAIIEKSSLELERWTLQERYAAICHYLLAQYKEDFAVSDVSCYSDYPVVGDYPDSAFNYQTESGGIITIYPLTSAYIQIIESIAEHGILRTNGNKRLAYLVGAMAAQMREMETEDGDLEAIVLDRAKALLNSPESEFLQLLGIYQRGLEETMHLLNYWFSDEGFIFLPGDNGLSRERGSGVQLPPARFSVLQSISEITQQIVGRP